MASKPNRRKKSSTGDDSTADQWSTRKVLPVEDTIGLIRSWHRQRCRAMETRKSLNLQLGSFFRSVLGWRPDMSDEEKDRIARTSRSIMEKPQDSTYEIIIKAFENSREPFVNVEKNATKVMEKLAENLPVWQSFGRHIRGFGRCSLAVIVAEAGDLSNYPTKAKLRKRMCLAVIDGKRQGSPGNGATKDDWMRHGYSPQRRSRMWNIGDTLIKGNRDGKYRSLYLYRKKIEVEKNPDIRPIVAHRRAQRYMEQRLLDDLWRAWRGTNSCLTDPGPSIGSPPPEFCEAAE